MRMIASAISLLVLAACGGGGSGAASGGATVGNGGAVQTPAADVFAGKAAGWDDVIENLQLDEATTLLGVITPGVSIPTSGEATYRGFGAVRIDPVGTFDGTIAQEADLVGDATVGINFGQSANNVTGTLTNFVESDGTKRDGTITLDPATLLRTAENGIVGTISGNVEGLDGQMNEISQGNYLGFVLSSNQGFFAEGNASVTGGSASAIDVNILADR